VPRGTLDPDEQIEDTVRRELSEEMGADCEEIVPLGPVYPSNAVSNEYSDLFLTRLTRLGQPDRHEAVARFEPLETSKLRSMIADENVDDGITLAAYARATARGLIV